MKPSDRKKTKADSSAVAGSSDNLDDSKAALALERVAVQGNRNLYVPHMISARACLFPVM